MKKVFQILMNLFKKKKNNTCLLHTNRLKVMKVISSCSTPEQLDMVSEWADKICNYDSSLDRLSRYGISMALVCRAYTIQRR